MDNFIAFFNQFWNYFVTLLCFVGAGAIGIVLGAVLSKKKAAKKAQEEEIEVKEN